MNAGTDYIGVGVGALVLNDKGNVLLLKKKVISNNQGSEWTIPGGEVLFGETFDQAIDREFIEETCLRITKKRQLDCINFLESNSHWVSLVFFIEAYEGTPAIGEPLVFDKIEWFDVYRLPLLNPMSKLTILQNLSKINK